MDDKISDKVKKEIDFRLKKLQDGNVELFSWEEVRLILKKKRDAINNHKR